MCYLGSIVARPKLKGIGGGVLQRVTRTVRHQKILLDFWMLKNAILSILDIISRSKIELNAGNSEYLELLIYKRESKNVQVRTISRKGENSIRSYQKVYNLLITNGVMNFKLTSLKLLVSLVIGFILGIIYFKSWTCMDCSQDVLIKTTLLPSLVLAIISALILYIIWSLIQKK